MSKMKEYILFQTFAVEKQTDVKNCITQEMMIWTSHSDQKNPTEFETYIGDSINLCFQGDLDSGIYYSERIADVTSHGWDVAYPLVKYGKLFKKLNKKEEELKYNDIKLKTKINCIGMQDPMEKRIALLKLIGAKQVEYADNKYVVVD